MLYEYFRSTKLEDGDRSLKTVMRYINHPHLGIFMKKAAVICWLTLCFGLGMKSLFAQKSAADSTISQGILEVAYNGFFPSGDFADRFGYTSQLGVNLGYKFRNGIYASTGAHALFSDVVREPGFLDNIEVLDRVLIADNGTLSGVRMIGSGIVVPLSVGKLFSRKTGNNRNSGFYVEAGGQYIQHRITISSREEEASSISGDYKKGYDRLTSGFGVREAFGYRHLANDGYVNFSIGFEFSQNITRSRRSINFDTGETSFSNRLDILSGFHFGWIFPLYERAPDKVYYY